MPDRAFCFLRQHRADSISKGSFREMYGYAQPRDYVFTISQVKSMTYVNDDAEAAGSYKSMIDKAIFSSEHLINTFREKSL